MDSKYLDLIIRDLSGEITPVEKEELWKWLPANRELYNEIKRVWDNSVDQAPQFPAEQKWEELKLRIEKSESSGSFKWGKWGKLAIAASIALLIAFSISLWNNNTNSLQEQVISNVFSAGEKIEIFYLPDSSVVWLNKNSKLIIDEDYNQSERNVSLEGEAFFQVMPDKEKPFFVYSGNTTTRVVGTAFNINAYTGKDVVITVESGAVEFYNTEHKMARLFLYPSDKAVCTSDGGVELISGRIDDEYVSKEERAKDWKNNKSQISENKISIAETTNPEGYLFNEFDWKDNLVKQAVIEGTIHNSAIFTSYNNIRLKAIYYTNDKSRMEVEYFDLAGNLQPGASVEYKFRLKNWFREADQVEVELEDAKPENINIK